MTKSKAKVIIKGTHATMLIITILGIMYLEYSTLNPMIGIGFGFLITIIPFFIQDKTIDKLDNTYAAETHQDNELMIKKITFAIQVNPTAIANKEELKQKAEAIYYSDNVIL